jgi:hypothetical protein
MACVNSDLSGGDPASPASVDGPQHLPGGSGGVTRVGDSVLRPTGPWTPAVHELLTDLADAGLDGIPHVLGTTDDGREILSYIEGDAVAVDDEVSSDQVLAEAVTWLRRFHEAAAGRLSNQPRIWRQSGSEPVAPAHDQIICHNDTGAYNWIVRDGHFAGMIDWDQAGPGDPLDDLAFLCWSGIPLFRGIPSADVGRRLRVVAEAYPRWSVDEVLDAVVRRMRTASERIARGISRGDPGMLSLAEHGEPRRTLDRVERFEARLPDLLTSVHDA